MKLFGWKLIGWQFRPCIRPHVSTLSVATSDGRSGWRYRVITVGPLQTRWFK